MPTVLIAAEGRTPECLRDLYHTIPLKSGEVPSKVDLKKVHPHMLMAGSSPDAAHVLSWTFGGSQRIVRKGQKLTMSADEVSFMLHRYPNTIKVTEAAEDDADTVKVVMLRVQKVERELEVAVAERDELQKKLTTLQALSDDHERLASQRLLEIEALKTANDSITKDDLQLKVALENAKTEITKLKKG